MPGRTETEMKPNYTELTSNSLIMPSRLRLEGIALHPSHEYAKIRFDMSL